MIFDDPITANQIQVGRYKKCKSNQMAGYVCQDIYINNIDDLLIGGTVSVRFGTTDDYRDEDKDEIVELINKGGFCFIAT